jgi:hypothetical protein
MWLSSDTQPPDPSSPAMIRFIKSMKIGYIEWHDGISYDLEALKEYSTEELNYIEALLLSRKNEDWRDVEALAALNTPAAIQALKDCLESSNLDCRLFAVRYLKEMNILDRIDQVVVTALPLTKTGEGFSLALALAKDYPSEAIKDIVLWCCLNGNESIRVLCAAMVLYLYGITTDYYDTSHKIVFEFHEPDRSKRIEPFTRLCRMINIDPEPFINSLHPLTA